MSSDYEKRKRAQEWVAERMRKSGVDSEKAHKESARIAREQDAKNAEKKGKG